MYIYYYPIRSRQYCAFLICAFIWLTLPQNLTSCSSIIISQPRAIRTKQGYRYIFIYKEQQPNVWVVASQIYFLCNLRTFTFSHFNEKKGSLIRWNKLIPIIISLDFYALWWCSLNLLNNLLAVFLFNCLNYRILVQYS